MSDATVKFRDSAEESFWKQVYVAYVGCNVPFEDASTGMLGCREVADRALLILRERQGWRDPYRTVKS